jgi:hypothetical protein
LNAIPYDQGVSLALSPFWGYSATAVLESGPSPGRL